MYKLFMLLLIFLYVSAKEDELRIKVDQGWLQGKLEKSRKGRSIRAFTGIPFAKPPVGELRFKPPVPLEAWDGILDATKSQNMCVQLDIFSNNAVIEGNEDCLFLNVYTPQVESSKNKLLPVIFNIHGGAFLVGKGDRYGPKYLLDKDVVLVSTNYRLGALGFLSTGDEVVPGNNGLKDQNLALKWTNKNIAQFGGDPERITVFGESAGGACSHYHVLSPLSKDLIKGAIFDSGSAVGPLAYPPIGEVVFNTNRLAAFLNCPTRFSKRMIDCMRKIDAYKIVDQSNRLMEWSYDPLAPFKPVVEPNLEGAFLSEDPIDIIKSGKAASVPIMTGLTTEDGAIKSTTLYSNYKLIEDLNRDFVGKAPIAMLFKEIVGKASPRLEEYSKKIRRFYLGDREIDNSTKNEITDMFTDAWFLVAEDTAVRLHAKYSEKPIYYFLFGYRGSVTFADLFGSDHNYDYGVCHVDELIYLFNFDSWFPNYTLSETDEKMTDIMVTLWTNFAETGTPTPESPFSGYTKWEPVKSDKHEYYFIKSPTDIKMQENMFPERVEFWRNLPTDIRRTRLNDEL